jgi:hypothetical protein
MLALRFISTGKFALSFQNIAFHATAQTLNNEKQIYDSIQRRASLVPQESRVPLSQGIQT